MTPSQLILEPTRLALARRRRGMTQTELADKCGKTSQYISMIENGQPAPRDLVKIFSSVLNFPEEFFYSSSVEEIAEEDVSFRAMRSMKSNVRNVGLGVSELVIHVLWSDLERRFSLPPVSIPDLQDKAPEEAADCLRVEWKLSYEPIQNMVHLLESKGIGVFWMNHPDPALDAISFWHEERPFVVLNLHKDAGERGRFDAAHELGHLVLHRNAKELNTKPIEKEANLFASAFLMPLETFGHECPNDPDLQALYKLKPRWKVSVSAMVMQGHQIGKFSDWQKRQAFKQLNALGMTKREKQLIPREQSRLHKMVFESLTRKGVSTESYAQTLCLNLDELEELMPVAKEFRVPSNPSTGPGEYQRGHLKIFRGGRG